MAQSASRKKAADIVPPLAVGVLILIAWETFCRALAIPPYLFPMPSVIAQTFVADAPALLHALWVTLRVTLIALALAVAIGATIAFLFVQSPIIERSFFPYAIILQVTPIVAIAPLIIILVKNTQGALIICATIIAIFPIISNTTVGLRSVDQGVSSCIDHLYRVVVSDGHQNEFLVLGQFDAARSLADFDRLHDGELVGIYHADGVALLV